MPPVAPTGGLQMKLITGLTLMLNAVLVQCLPRRPQPAPPPSQSSHGLPLSAEALCTLIFS